ncbi:uncharacterized protein BJ171DRAFT_503032 [Polychytrium aggregatum]|uniref:uncharacterized protein n=1 Tax=Polychytrium aggregatum TaxID=110093 RepID=UPI0022FF2CBA|nr:uncharacterized protein BJ171DRAFT_503032 [Polychytrium aggregatum]KAI9205114.1 hypothetical protein BJ171DRAFT_503032 [Polychytrium aggregatum]
MEQSKAAFRERMQAQPVIRHERIAPASSSAMPPSVSKPKRPSFVSSTYASAPQASDLVAKQLFLIINILKSKDSPFSFDEIYQETGYDLTSSTNDELIESIRTNLKIISDFEAQTLQFRPKFDIKSKHDLLRLLESQKLSHGLEVDDEFKESFPNWQAAVQELEKSEDIIVFMNKEGAGAVPRVLFYNDSSLNVHMSEEFKTYWHQIKLPPEGDLEKELEKAGLKSMDTFSTKPKSVTKVKVKPKKTNKRIKLTNTHLEDIDLTKDFMGS